MLGVENIPQHTPELARGPHAADLIVADVMDRLSIDHLHGVRFFPVVEAELLLNHVALRPVPRILRIVMPPRSLHA